MSDVDYWHTRIAETGRRIAALLSTDARQFFSDTVKERFVASPLADSLTDQALAALKARALGAAEAQAVAVAEALGDGVWRACAAPAAGADLRAVPAVQAAFEDLDAALGAFLEAEDLSGAPVQWRLPKRFIDGDNLVTLERTLFKALAQRDAVQAAAERQAEGQSVAQRRQRWDEA